MAISILKMRDHYNAPNRKDYLVDTDADFESLPCAAKCAPGSTAYSVETGHKKILNNAGVWMEYKGGSGGGGGDELVDVSVEGM